MRKIMNEQRKRRKTKMKSTSEPDHSPRQQQQQQQHSATNGSSEAGNAQGAAALSALVNKLKAKAHKPAQLGTTKPRSQ